MRVRASREASNDDVPSKEIWVLDSSEDGASIVDVAGWRCREGQDTASCYNVIEKTSFDELGMDFFEVVHGGALGF